jgi:hypothetical protein
MCVVGRCCPWHGNRWSNRSNRYSRACNDRQASGQAAARPFNRRISPRATVDGVAAHGPPCGLADLVAGAADRSGNFPDPPTTFSAFSAVASWDRATRRQIARAARISGSGPRAQASFPSAAPAPIARAAPQQPPARCEPVWPAAGRSGSLLAFSGGKRETG